MDKISDHISKLISAYTTGEIDENQFNDLKKWLNEAPGNKKIFTDYLLFYKKSQRIGFLDGLDADVAWDKVAARFKRPANDNPNKSKVPLRTLRPISRILKYAAVTVLLVGLGYFYQQGYFSDNPEIVTSPDSIVLQLGDGSIEIINSDASSNIVDSKGNVIGAQKKDILVYTNEVSEKVLTYNTLKVPYGKRFQVVLSDGTKVDLNAGTSLKYPIKFMEGKNRQVFLEGEAYFDVVEDIDHPFVVNANDVNVRVLGTKFNISSYPEDSTINTVLIEGSVSLYDKDISYSPETSTLLEPGYQASWDKNRHIINIDEADINTHTAWINGRIIFRHIPFNDVIKKLERQYNITIINNNEALGKDFITASFDIETIEQVFGYINEIHPIEYTIKNDTVIIN